MLFYASLLLFSLAVSAVVLWVYRVVYDTGKAAYRAIFPSTKEQYKADKQAAIQTSINNTPTPWGWTGGPGPRRVIPVALAASKPPVPAPWGWKGSTSNTESASHSLKGNAEEAAASLWEMVDGNAGNEETGVGWPYREEKFEFADRQYKVTSKSRVKRTNMEEISMPWGW